MVGLILKSSEYYFYLASPSYLELNTGHKIGTVGLGTWQSSSDDVGKAVECAIDCGYRHIDCALLYSNEHAIGSAMENKLNEGKITREQLFVTSRLWNTYHEPEAVRPSFMETLTNLKLQYLDLYLMHCPIGLKNIDGQFFPSDENGKGVGNDVDYIDTWKEMEKLVDDGLVRSIGVSNFNEYQVRRVIREGRIKPSAIQIEIHPYHTQQSMVDFCQQQGIVVVAYSPFGLPVRPWIPDGGEDRVLDDATLKRIAGEVGRSAAQVVIRYLAQRGMCVIPKSVTPSRIAANFQIFDFELTKEQMASINDLNRNRRAFTLFWWDNHKYFPFRENYME